MYLHLGCDVIVNFKDVIGIFDMDGTTTSGITRRFLSRAQKDGKVINVSPDLPKTFVVCTDGSVYISQISAYTLAKRADKFDFEG